MTDEFNQDECNQELPIFSQYEKNQNVLVYNLHTYRF